MTFIGSTRCLTYIGSTLGKRFQPSWWGTGTQVCGWWSRKWRWCHKHRWGKCKDFCTQNQCMLCWSGNLGRICTHLGELERQKSKENFDFETNKFEITWCASLIRISNHASWTVAPWLMTFSSTNCLSSARIVSDARIDTLAVDASLCVRTFMVRRAANIDGSNCNWSVVQCLSELIT